MGPLPLVPGKPKLCLSLNQIQIECVAAAGVILHQPAGSKEAQDARRVQSGGLPEAAALTKVSGSHVISSHKGSPGASSPRSGKLQAQLAADLRLGELCSQATDLGL